MANKKSAVDKLVDEADKEDQDQVAAIRKLERDLHSKTSKLKLSETKRKHAEEELTRLTDSFGTVVDTKDQVSGKPAKLKRRGKRSTASAILCWNDWHSEACIDPQVITAANEFNLDIAAQRINQLWNKSLYLLDFASNISNINEIVVWLGGDLINGTIHEELEEGNFLGPSEATLFIQQHVAAGLDILLEKTDLPIRVTTSIGNHGRTTKKKRISTAYRHNWEWLAYNNLAMFYVKEPRIQFDVGKGYHSWMSVQGHDIRFHHGDSIRFHGGVGGVTIPLKKAIAQWNKQKTAHLDVLGHFHQFIDMWDFVVCGCLCGYDPYAQEIKADFQPPTQTFIVIDEKHGKILAMPIYLGESK